MIDPTIADGLDRLLTTPRWLRRLNHAASWLLTWWRALDPAERSDYVIAAIAVGVAWGIATGRI